MNEQNTKKWIIDGPTAELITKVENFAKNIQEQELTTSQIRNIYGKVKQIQAKGIENKKTDFLMLKPMVAYASARMKSKGLTSLKDEFINPGIVCVSEQMNNTEDLKKRFLNFVKLFEAILAYHKAFGGR